jgi:hypothetical protein
MPRWLRVIRGMIGTGLAFAIGGPVIVSIIGALFMVFGNASLSSVVFTAARASVVSFVIGVVFSGILALASRARLFEKLSLTLFTALGGGVGLLAWTAMGLSGAFTAWNFETGLVNLILLTGIGTGAAAATLLVARKAGAKTALGADEEHLELGEGEANPLDMSRDAEPVRHRD